MGGPPAPLKNAADTYVSEKKPAKNFGQTSKIWLSDTGAANTCYGYLYFGLPSGISGTSVTNGKLRLYSGGPGWGGSVTVTIQRVSSKFAAGRVNWNRKPSVLTGTKTLTKTSAPDGTMWEFDVKSFLQEVASGSAWYGFRISVTGSNLKWMYSAQGPEQYRPELEVSWSDSPDAPERLIPDNGLAVSVAKPTLQWEFSDPSGSDDMQSFNLRLFTDSTRAANNTIGTGDVDVTMSSAIPQVDLDDVSAYGGLAVGGTLYWRVRVTSGAGQVSDWSDVATFTRVSKGTLTLNNPAAGSPAFVNETTPPFSWTFTGQTQKSFAAFLSTPETPAVYLWRSGVVPGTDNAVTPPDGAITTPGKTYRLTLRVFDTIARADVADDDPYVEVVRDFVYQFASSVGTVTALTGTPDTAKPQIVLGWTDGTAPDEYVILRDGKRIDDVVPSEVFVSGTHYEYTDDQAAPRVNHTWEVARKVNGVTSSGNPTVTNKVKAIAPVLSQVGGGKPAFFINPQVAADKAESSDIHYIIGDAPPVLITQAIRGYEGTVSGLLADNVVPGLTAAGQLDNLRYFKDNPGVPLKFIWIDQVMQIVLRNVSWDPVPYADGTVEYLASFEFFQTDF